MKAKKQDEKGLAKFEKDKDREAKKEQKRREMADFNGDTLVEFGSPKDKTPKSVANIISDPTSFDKLSDTEKRKAGDEILKYCSDTYKEMSSRMSPNGKYDPKESRKIIESNDYDDYNKAQEWLTNRVYDKSGSWNSGYFEPGTNGAKEYPKLEKAYRDEWHRWSEVEKEIGYKPSKQGSNEYNRLQRALKNDAASQAFAEATRKAEKDLCGAILKDMGFSDTPENRSMIMQFAFLD